MSPELEQAIRFAAGRLRAEADALDRLADRPGSRTDASLGAAALAIVIQVPGLCRLDVILRRAAGED
jgi:hypothetical protein